MERREYIPFPDTPRLVQTRQSYSTSVKRSELIARRRKRITHPLVLVGIDFYIKPNCEGQLSNSCRHCPSPRRRAGLDNILDGERAETVPGDADLVGDLPSRPLRELGICDIDDDPGGCRDRVHRALRGRAQEEVVGRYEVVEHDSGNVVADSNREAHLDRLGGTGFLVQTRTAFKL